MATVSRSSDITPNGKEKLIQKPENKAKVQKGGHKKSLSN